MDGALNRIGFHNLATRLVLEEIDRVRGMVPKQMICPAAGLTERVHIRAAEKVGLHIHLLDVESACFDFLVHILMRGIEAPGVAAHGDLAGGLSCLHYFLTIGIHITQRDFHLHMLARFQASQRLRRMHLGWRAKDHSINFFDFQSLCQIIGHMGNAIFVSHLLCLGHITANHGDDFHIINELESIQMLDAKCASAGECNMNCHHFPRSVVF